MLHVFKIGVLIFQVMALAKGKKDSSLFGFSYGFAFL
jgi:hypothetical protein